MGLNYFMRCGAFAVCIKMHLKQYSVNSACQLAHGGPKTENFLHESSDIGHLLDKIYQKEAAFNH